MNILVFFFFNYFDISCTVIYTSEQSSPVCSFLMFFDINVHITYHIFFQSK